MVDMKLLRAMVALIACLTFAGRAAAQWNFMDLDATLTQMMDHQVQGADDSSCCCDEEEEADDCCEDSCEVSLCPVCADQIVPATPFDSVQTPASTPLLILEVSSALFDGCRLALERPPRIV